MLPPTQEEPVNPAIRYHKSFGENPISEGTYSLRGGLKLHPKPEGFTVYP